MKMGGLPFFKLGRAPYDQYTTTSSTIAALISLWWEGSHLAAMGLLESGHNPPPPPRAQKVYGPRGSKCEVDEPSMLVALLCKHIMFQVHIGNHRDFPPRLGTLPC